MKRLFFLIFVAVLGTAAAKFVFAQTQTPNGIRGQQWDATGSALYGRDLGVPPASATGHGVFFYNGTSILPEIAGLGTGLVYNGGTRFISHDGSAVWSLITGKPTFFSGDYNDLTNKPSLFSGAYADLTGKPTLFDGTWASLTGKPSFAPVATSGSYNDLSSKPTIPAAQVNSDWNAVSGAAQILNKPTIPTIPSRSFNYTTRTLNSCFQVSSTRDALVTYSVDIATSLSLTAGQQGTVYLRTYTNSGCSTGVQEVTRFVNGQTGTLTIGLALTQNVTGTLTGVIPAGVWVQLVTENNTGTPTFTARPGQETLL